MYLGVDNRWALSAGSLRESAALASVRGYRKLLEEAGYSDVRIWCALPSHEDPRFLVTYEQRSFDHFLRTFASPPQGFVRRLTSRVLNRLGLLRRMTRSYCIVGRRS